MASVRMTGDPVRDEAAAELNAAVELVLETVAEVNGSVTLAHPVVQDFVEAARKLAVGCGWVEVVRTPDEIKRGVPT